MCVPPPPLPWAEHLRLERESQGLGPHVDDAALYAWLAELLAPLDDDASLVEAPPVVEAWVDGDAVNEGSDN